MDLNTSAVVPRLLARRLPAARLEVCIGTQDVTSNEFRPRSLVPSDHWTSVEAVNIGTESASATFDSGTPLDGNIALLKIPFSTPGKYLISELNLDNADLPDSELRNELDQVCRRLSSSWNLLDYKGKHHVVRGSSSLSTTRHGEDHRLVGLHVDTWERKPVCDLDSAKSRLCVNLGPGPRWFAFAPLDLYEIAERIGLSPKAVLSSSQVREWVRDQTTSVPVYRLRVKPGEGYIAPTERLLHDGLSSSRRGEWLYTIFGKFDCTEYAAALSVV